MILIGHPVITLWSAVQPITPVPSRMVEQVHRNNPNVKIWGSCLTSSVPVGWELLVVAHWTSPHRWTAPHLLHSIPYTWGQTCKVRSKVQCQEEEPPLVTTITSRPTLVPRSPWLFCSSVIHNQTSVDHTANKELSSLFLLFLTSSNANCGIVRTAVLAPVALALLCIWQRASSSLSGSAPVPTSLVPGRVELIYLEICRHKLLAYCTYLPEWWSSCS